MTTKETATEIRKTLKAHGWNSRMVSIRVRHLGVDSGITITVRDPSVPLSAVHKLAHEHEHIDRCESTGEILLGGNMYIDAHYSTNVLDPMKAKILARLETKAVNPGVHVDLGSGLIAWKCQENGYYWLDRDGWDRGQKLWGIDFTAQRRQSHFLMMGTGYETIKEYSSTDQALRKLWSTIYPFVIKFL